MSHDRNMNGLVCVVTGASSGIGLETARGIATRGATVVLIGRSEERSRIASEQIRATTGNACVEYLVADLSLPRDIARVAGQVRERYPRLHVLVNNAGGMFLNGQVTADGVEMTLALNHLGYYLLTRALLDVVVASAPARIVNVSSVAHIGCRIDMANLDFRGWTGYKKSKLANMLFTYELARRLEGTGVTANALHPGLVASGFGANNSGLYQVARPLVHLMSISNERGAATSIHLACSRDVEGVTGQYFDRCRPRRSSAASYDREAAARLWEISALMTGLPAD